MTEKRYILVYDPNNSSNWGALVSEYRHRASEAKGGLSEIRVNRWYPASKLRNLLEALRLMKPEILEDIQFYLHCQDVLLSDTDISTIRAMENEFGVIATTEYGVIE